MKSLVLDGLEDYARAHSAARPDVYAALREATLASTEAPQMQVGHLEGLFLKLLVQALSARTVVEVGTFTGYSALCMAEGLSATGAVHTFDIDPEATGIAQRHWAMVPWGGRIVLHLGPAADTLPEVLPGLGAPVDFAFIDADKEGYIAYWEAIVPHLRPGGMIAVDNVLWSGKVLAPQEASDHAVAAFNAHARADTRMEGVMLTVRDGLFVARRRG